MSTAKSFAPGYPSRVRGRRTAKVPEVEEVEDIQAPIGLSANSMARVVGVSSIRRVGKIMGKKVSSLVDSGATQLH